MIICSVSDRVEIDGWKRAVFDFDSRKSGSSRDGTNVRTFASALMIGISFAAAGCTTAPTPLVALGPWGGPHIGMQVTATGARLEYDCAEGVIEQPLRADADGWVTATGVHIPGHGGPIREGEILPALRARYEGRLAGDQMRLLVILIETGVELGEFELRRGRSGVLVRCL